MSRNGYEVHESFWSDFKMHFKMIFWALAVGFLFQLGFLMYGLYNVNQEVMITNTNIVMPPTVFAKYHFGFTGILSDGQAEIEKTLLPYANGWKELPLEDYRKFVDWLTNGEYLYQKQKSDKWFNFSFLNYGFSIAYLVLFWGTAKTKSDEKFIRGAQLTPLKEFNKKLAAAAKKNQLSALRIGETVIPFEMESKHTLILGSAGSGKSVLLNQLIAQINARKRQLKTSERCVFYDIKGEFISKQFRKGDLIFNPFDDRSIGWNIFNEIEIEADLKTISNAIFCPPGSISANDQYWYKSAASVFACGLQFLKMNNTTSNKDLWLFFSQQLEPIIQALKTLPPDKQGPIKHIDKADAPASASIISILQQRIEFFEHLVGKDGDFSFSKFMRGHGDGPQPNLFLLNIPKYKEEFKPLLTLAIDCMVREVLSLPDDRNRRIWFIVDELGTLNRMESILDLETVGRSKGGCLVCANQDLGRIEQEYGKANLKSFVNNFNTTFMFRINEPDTAEFLSRAIGERQVIKTSQSRQMSPNDVGDRKSFSEQEKLERLILPTEFQELPVGTAILTIAGYGTTKIEIPHVESEARYPSFVVSQELQPFGEGLTAPETIAESAEAPQTPADKSGFNHLEV